MILLIQVHIDACKYIEFTSSDGIAIWPNSDKNFILMY